MFKVILFCVLLVSSIFSQVREQTVLNLFSDAEFNESSQTNDGTLQRRYLIEGGSLLFWGNKDTPKMFGLVLSNETDAQEGMLALVKFLAVFFSNDDPVSMNVLSFVSTASGKSHGSAKTFNGMKVSIIHTSQYLALSITSKSNS